MKLLNILKDYDVWSLIVLGIIIISYFVYDFLKKNSIKNKYEISLNDVKVEIIEKIITWLENENNHPCMTIKNQLLKQELITEFRNELKQLGKDNNEIEKAIEKIISIMERKFNNV